MNHHEAIVIDSDESHTEDEDSQEVQEVERHSAGTDAEGKGKRRRFVEPSGGEEAPEEAHAQGQAQAEASASTSTSTSASASLPMPQNGIAAPAGGVLSRSERRALEAARRVRQRQRRRERGEPSESESEGEGAGAGGVKHEEREVEEEPARRPVKPLPSSSSSGANFRSRSYVSENEAYKPAKSKAAASTSAHWGATKTEAGAYADDAPTGASTHAHAATVGLGSGAKPALRRILGGERFWEGAVKRSYNRYAGDGVPFSDLILPTTKHNPAGLTHAVVASYCYDFDWLAGILPSRSAAQPGRNAPSGPELTFILLEQNSGGGRGGGGGPAAGVHQLAVPGWVALVMKSLGRDYTCQHMKFLLLFYADRVRLAILTGNLIESDWSTLENAAFVQDFPLLPGSQRDTSTDCYAQLNAVLRSLALPPGHAAVKNLSRYDLKRGPTIVASLASQWPIKGWDAISKVGLGRLAAQAKALLSGSGSGGGGGVDLEVHGSSMGSYSLRWLQQFHLAASGLGSALPLPKSDAAATKAYRSATSSATPTPPLKILFPTRRFVERESAAGPPGGGCHFGKPAVLDKFRGLVYHARAARHAGVLMHQKGVLALRAGVGVGRDAWEAGDGKGKEGDEVVGYTYLGSANFTMNAWGNISLPSSSSASASSNSSGNTSVQMTANNWELGVLLPLRRADLLPGAELSSNARSAVPWQRPARPYGEGDVPWSATEHGGL